jgi:hypothetical protein
VVSIVDKILWMEPSAPARCRSARFQTGRLGSSGKGSLRRESRADMGMAGERPDLARTVAILDDTAASVGFSDHVAVPQAPATELCTLSSIPSAPSMS